MHFYRIWKGLIMFKITQVIIILFSITCFAQVDWTNRTSGTTYNINSITFGDSQFIAVGGNSTILTSSDGMNWTSRNSGTTVGLNSITYGNNQFVAVGGGYIMSQYNATTTVTSTDGITWANITNNGGAPYYLYSITYGNNQYVALGTGNHINTSVDGISWTENIVTSSSLNSITYGNNQFIADGYGGTMLTSPNGTTWTSQTTGTSKNLASITYGNNQYIAVGDSGIIITSSDGILWTHRTSGLSSYLFSIVYGNNQYVVVGESGSVLTSTDGITWTSQISGITHHLSSITYGNSQYVAVSISGTIHTSPDAELSIAKKQSPTISSATLCVQYMTPNTLSIITPRTMYSSRTEVSIKNICGKKVFENTLSISAGETRIKINTLPPGLYIFGIKSNGQKMFAKFVVAK
ncbi:MAG: hypothetical protein A2268_01215 [Candidatus Raymondbacteria bacterium RifOxyA12_full_50_37]|uniref:Secretion system C-terminal sorting domain-containing protein n=1 Tax=Candidatus Raymondbacteria bacterium RIFOXYD12_FULL_49_13 TaxID=1817890 RepID=A0A1F7FCQ0_UNCRA|nr:MAG: hypothetical protein A2268_01215 [Candidatus Raymondbacteria bacterium RifOxyA12_full_50_37]OGJ86422.1 MAG: hypothetical protein A2248_14180 [Candidatus Raymondbacteria bacterium RIFOXYA2_FULL_49_16]OGJ87920.1 MAG: hypothetical protein A2350_15175 [Candidatus Raymondbacteria bacterium RifOxyB12_full_50_8]OGJ95592.1 MAG: hypothetical protein A2453_12955 [Candidatus Raymondbacteria bacterium RIFOXYC2_FULL_50_21]OGK04454.1 MAG: hypothetical protein A2519_11375 [Candidatus Raymondbacteria b